MEVSGCKKLNFVMDSGTNMNFDYLHEEMKQSCKVLRERVESFFLDNARVYNSNESASSDAETDESESRNEESSVEEKGNSSTPQAAPPKETEEITDKLSNLDVSKQDEKQTVAALFSQDAEDFREKFKGDITASIDYLAAQLTAFRCASEAEFSQAQCEVICGVKSFINAKEREWLDEISVIKSLFVANVEILLAGTKREVTLPPSEACATGSRKDSMDSSESFVNETGTVGAPVDSSEGFVNETGTVGAQVDSSDGSANETGTFGAKVQSPGNGSSYIELDIPPRVDNFLYHKESTDFAESSENKAIIVENSVQSSSRGAPRSKPAVQNVPESLPSTSKKLPGTCSEGEKNDDLQSSKYYSGALEVNDAFKYVNIPWCLLPCYRVYCFMFPWQLGMFVGPPVECEVVIIPYVPVVSAPPLMIL